LDVSLIFLPMKFSKSFLQASKSVLTITFRTSALRYAPGQTASRNRPFDTENIQSTTNSLQTRHHYLPDGCTCPILKFNRWSAPFLLLRDYNKFLTYCQLTTQSIVVKMHKIRQILWSDSDNATKHIMIDYDNIATRRTNYFN
jgi:hypothetical protein